MGDEYVAGYDTAVLPVLEWVQTNDWMDAYGGHAGVFYQELAEAFEEPVSEVLAQLPTALWARAARCCFDDFLTVEYEGSPCNVLDQYLDQVGMDLEEANVDFLIAFRTSVVRVYYVVDRKPYDSVTLRDLSGGDVPVQIADEMLTAALMPGDHIATRILKINGKDYLAGSILVLSEETLETFKAAFEYTFKEEMRAVEKYLQKDIRQRNIVRQRVLKGAASAVSGMWVGSVLIALLDTPALANEDDPASLFQAAVPYSSNLEAIVEFLEAHPDLDRPVEREFFWLWQNDRSDPEASLKAMVWISGPDIYLESCERSRIEEATGALLGLLGDSVEDARIWEIDVDDDQDYEYDEDEEDEEDEDGDDIPLIPMPLTDEETAAFRERMHAFLDHQFRSLLDSPAAELKEQVPRELAKTVKGRKQLSKWLESVEATLHSNTAQVGLADYDLTWMWKELGIESHRQCSLFE